MACTTIAMDATFENAPPMPWITLKNKNDSAADFKILNDSITTEKYGIGFKKGNDALKDKVQATLDEMFKDGTVAKIAKDYGISEDALIQPK